MMKKHRKPDISFFGGEYGFFGGDTAHGSKESKSKWSQVIGRFNLLRFNAQGSKKSLIAQFAEQYNVSRFNLRSK